MRTTRSPTGVARALSICLMAMAVAVPTAIAHDLDKQDNNSPEIQAWVTSLTNGPGVACCATADGWRPSDVQWDTNTKGYRVLIEGHWVQVPDEAVIHGPNKLGHAEVWFYHIDGLPAIRCFLPGEGM